MSFYARDDIRFLIDVYERFQHKKEHHKRIGTGMLQKMLQFFCCSCVVVQYRSKFVFAKFSQEITGKETFFVQPRMIVKFLRNLSRFLWSFDVFETETLWILIFCWRCWQNLKLQYFDISLSLPMYSLTFFADIKLLHSIIFWRSSWLQINYHLEDSRSERPHMQIIIYTAFHSNHPS